MGTTFGDDPSVNASLWSPSQAMSRHQQFAPDFAPATQKIIVLADNLGRFPGKYSLFNHKGE